MRKMIRLHRVFILTLVAILATRCSGAVQDPTRQTLVPTVGSTEQVPDPDQVTTGVQDLSRETIAGWQAASPESQGIDSDLLADMFLTVEERGTNLHSLMILRNGSTVLEAYVYPHNAERKHVMFSITKSFMATLIGIAIQLGYIESVEQRIIDLLPERSIENLDPRKEQVTLEDVLTMTSGLGWVESDATFADMYYREDWLGYVLGKPMEADPGRHFSYCSGCSHILSGVLQEKTGQELLEFARENLFDPLEISDFHWETDRSGLPIGGWGLELTTRDMAKLGILYLNLGRWNGALVVPGDWVAETVEYHTDTGDGVGYGYQWWIYPKYGAYAAMGRGGQTVFVIPEQNLVIATTAEIENHEPILDMIDEFILPAIQSDQALPPNPEGEERLKAHIDQLALP